MMTTPQRDHERQRLFVDLDGTLLDDARSDFRPAMVEAIERFMRAAGRLEVMVVTGGDADLARAWAVRLSDQMRRFSQRTIFTGAAKLSVVGNGGILAGDVWVDDDSMLRASIQARGVTFYEPQDFIDQMIGVTR